MINVGIIGFGMSAKVFHLPFIRCCEGLHLSAIVSSQPSECLPPDVTHYRTVEQLLGDGSIDLIINAAPTALHFSLSMAVIAANKHLVIEKPLATNFRDGKALLAATKKQHSLVTTYHNRRWSSDFLTSQKLIADKTLGTVYLAELHFDRFRPDVKNRWKENPGDGSGVLYDLGPHLIDQAIQLFGFPDSLSAQNRLLRPQSQSTDYFHIQLHYPDKEVILHSSPYNSAIHPTIRIEGDNGCYVKYGLDPQEGNIQRGLSPTDQTFGMDTGESIYYDKSGTAHSICTEKGNYQNFYTNLRDAILGQASIAVTVEQALNVIYLIELAQHSSNKKQTVQVDPSSLICK